MTTRPPTRASTARKSKIMQITPPAEQLGVGGLHLDLLCVAHFHQETTLMDLLHAALNPVQMVCPHESVQPAHDTMGLSNTRHNGPE
jgi:hypothetical protein